MEGNAAEAAKFLNYTGYTSLLLKGFVTEKANLSVNLIKEAPMGGAICDYFGIVQPPKDGHLWDLAWDERQPCIGNHPTWSQFVRDLRQGMGLAPFGQPDQGWNKHGVYNTGPTRACWMSRGKNRWTDEALVEKWVRSTCHGKQVNRNRNRNPNPNLILSWYAACGIHKCEVRQHSRHFVVGSGRSI